MKWSELLTNEVKATYAQAEVLIGMVDDSSLGWKPSTGENWMTTGQLIRHISDSCGAPMKGFVTGDWGMPDGMDMADLKPEDMMPPAEKLPTVESVAEALSMLVVDKKTALDMVAKCSDETLGTAMVAAPWSPEKKLLGYYLLDMVEHLKTHRSQLFYYLKLQGKPVHTGHLWG